MNKILLILSCLVIFVTLSNVALAVDSLNISAYDSITNNTITDFNVTISVLGLSVDSFETDFDGWTSSSGWQRSDQFHITDGSYSLFISAQTSNITKTVDLTDVKSIIFDYRKELGTVKFYVSNTLMTTFVESEQIINNTVNVSNYTGDTLLTFESLAGWTAIDNIRYSFKEVYDGTYRILESYNTTTGVVSTGLVPDSSLLYNITVTSAVEEGYYGVTYLNTNITSTTFNAYLELINDTITNVSIGPFPHLRYSDDPVCYAYYTGDIAGHNVDYSWYLNDVIWFSGESTISNGTTSLVSTLDKSLLNESDVLACSVGISSYYVPVNSTSTCFGYNTVCYSQSLPYYNSNVDPYYYIFNILQNMSTGDNITIFITENTIVPMLSYDKFYSTYNTSTDHNVTFTDYTYAPANSSMGWFRITALEELIMPSFSRSHFSSTHPDGGLLYPNGLFPYYELNITIGNSPPFITLASISDNTTHLSCNYDYNDWENDIENNTEIRWYVNNIIEITNNITSNINTSELDFEDAVFCSIIPKNDVHTGYEFNSSIFVIGDTTNPLFDGFTYPTSASTSETISLCVDIIENNSFMIGYPRISWYNPNTEQVEGNFTMTLSSGNTYCKSYNFFQTGTYTNITFYAMDGSGNSNSTIGPSITISSPILNLGGGGSNTAPSLIPASYRVDPSNITRRISPNTFSVLTSRGGEFKIINEGNSRFFVNISVDKKQTTSIAADWLNFNNADNIRNLEINAGSGLDPNIKFVRYNLNIPEDVAEGTYKIVVEVKSGSQVAYHTINIIVGESWWTTKIDFLGLNIMRINLLWLVILLFIIYLLYRSIPKKAKLRQKKVIRRYY